jgi:hypothetical protein
MNGAILKRVGGAGMLLALVGAAVAVLWFVLPWAFAYAGKACAAAIAVVGLEASPFEAFWFVALLLAALALFGGRK